MLEMKKGSIVPHCEQLSEQYEVTSDAIYANVNASKIHMVFESFIMMQEQDLFFILELPAKADEEKRLRKDNTCPFHKNIYYIDGLTPPACMCLLEKYGELLINDGVTRFGFGLHDNSAELMADKYNMLILWSEKLESYIDLFEKHGIPQVKKCFTAWETFSEDEPGVSRRIEVNGLSTMDLPQEMAKFGIYLAEQREE